MNVFELVGTVTINTKKAVDDILELGKKSKETSDGIGDDSKKNDENNKKSETAWDRLKSAVAKYKEQGLSTSQAWKKAVEDMQGDMVKAESGISSAFKRIAAAVATYLAVDKIISFGKACVETAATVQAQTAQFEAAFKDLQGSATDTFQKIADDTGILVTRLQTAGTQAFSQFKGAGMDAADALKQTDSFMRMAADAAAYYDMSLEETTSLMRSFIRGNTEAGDRIGLFTSETQRNNKAIELMGKKYIELTEAEKQLVMLDIANEIYEAAGAMGQAQREADGYENVVGNLKEAWRQFQAVIGAPILEKVIPILKNVTGGITAVTEAFKGSETLGEGFSAVLDIVKSKATQLIPVMIDSVAAKAPEFAGKAFDLITGFADGIQKAIPKIVNKGAELVGNLGQVIKDNIPGFAANALTLIEGFVATAQENLPTILAAGMDFIGNLVQGIMNALPILIERVPAIVSNIANLINDNMPMILQKGWDILVMIGQGMLAAIPVLLENIPQIFVAIWNVWQAINWIDLGKNALEAVKTGFVAMKTALTSTAGNIFTNIKDAMLSPLTKGRDLIKGIIDKIKGFFNFKITWPHIPLPHFTISPSGWGIGDLLRGVTPTLGIDWFAKGGILTKPTAFGFNPQNGKLMVGGEAGDEAIAPIDQLLGYVRTAVNESNGKMAEVIQNIFDLLILWLPELANMQMVLDSGALVGEIASPINTALGKISTNKDRGR